MSGISFACIVVAMLVLAREIFDVDAEDEWFDEHDETMFKEEKED